MASSSLPEEPDPPSRSDRRSTGPARRRWRHVLFGKPRDLTDTSLFHHLSLIPFLAWVGLGADGLSSSAYGPEEAFRTLGEHKYLAVALAFMMATTVLVISSAYRRIIEQFPHGGGGYVVATKLLGERAGLVSGSALLVDYVLTITISIAAAGDALFSLVDVGWHGWKLPFEVAAIAGLTVLNIRGVKESVLALTPIFLVFILTHLVVIVGGLVGHAPELPRTAREVAAGFREGYATLGLGGLFMLFIHAYSLGGGTYTGIEAVSNGLPIMREPRAETAKRTMVYMGTSLAITATGLLVCYLLWGIEHVPGKTMNAVLVETLARGFAGGHVFVILTLVAEGALLVVAAQAGFIDGPRVLANMAVDSWVPHRFAALSERFTTQNGIVLMGLASLAALFYTHGDVQALVVMYAINVFVTFSLSMFGMTRHTWAHRATTSRCKRRLALFGGGFLLCATILTFTVIEKLLVGGWLTLAITGSVIAVCFLIRRHYRGVYAQLQKLYGELADPRIYREVARVIEGVPADLDPKLPTAVVLVASFGGLGIHTTLNLFRAFPGHFRNLVFVSVGVVDSGGFKGREEVDALRARTEGMLREYVELARDGLGVPAAYRCAIGTDAVEEATCLCLALAQELPKATFFSGKIQFENEGWYQRLLHNETAYAVQKRLNWAGLTMVVLPARVH